MENIIREIRITLKPLLRPGWYLLDQIEVYMLDQVKVYLLDQVEVYLLDQVGSGVPPEEHRVPQFPADPHILLD